MRNFVIHYREKKKYNPTERKIVVEVAKNFDSAEVGPAAHAALDLFCTNFGNLNRLDVLDIQEIDKETGESIGEPIVPTGDSIVPIR